MAPKKSKKDVLNNKRKLITKNEPKSPVSEQYKTIRTNIQFSAVDQEMRSIMVTSAGPGDGKSTTVANLAVVFAQQGNKVLLVDADLRKPTVHYTFGVTNVRGLTNVLSNQLEIEDAAVSTEVDDLFILTSGPIPPNPAELMGSRLMKNFLEKAYEQFDIVLFDTPPVLVVTDGQVLSNHCDGTVLVVSSGRTEMEAAGKAKDILENTKSKLLGVVLNNKKAKDTSYYYYYATK
ncbi:CpsD/CapB family tyrosine-protein kinase [Falsibacillus albus]|uniref:non-specific protein-tyrosine kinase n=1 Tax=Falsibacillus albus TaxID=2478915 RepID=A0A3L7JXF0_9BACI|nr:CpsD/CapB family tyrosine-protein kinase [Falsibacillus albus]RLQ94799.1 polysaccharide biosynthesis tyrosine autokinase [Falsibacillus albus]